MPSTFSPNKLLNLQGTGDNVGTWGTVVNSQVFSILDLNLGGRLAISVAGSSNITVSSSQARNIYHTLSGVITGNIDYILPNVGSFYFLKNDSTGSFTITAKISGGTGIVIPQGTVTMVFTNPDTTALTSASTYVPSQAGVFIGGTTGGTGNAQTITVTTPGFSLTAGYMVVCKAGASNTNTTTLAVNGLTAKNVYKQTSTGAAALASGDIQSGDIIAAVYDGTQFQLVSSNGAHLTRTNNLSDLTSASTARTNLGLDAAGILAIVGPVLLPVGSYYLNETDSTNPATLFGFGTWVAITDKFIVAHGSTYTTTGGAATVTLSEANLPSSVTLDQTSGGDVNNATTGAAKIATAQSGARTTSYTVALGSDTAFSIIPPYQAAYIWKRTA